MTNSPVPTTLEDPAPTGRRSGRLLPRVALAFFVGLVAVLVIGVGALYAYDQQYRDRILPGVRVGSVDLSGMTAGEAASRLRQTYGDLATGQIVLVAGDKEIVLPYSRVGRAADVDSMVGRAMSIGRAGNAIERVIANARTAFRGVDIAPEVRSDQASLTRWVNALAAAQQLSPEDAVVARTGTGFTITPSTIGRRADPAPALATLTAALARFDAPAEIRVELTFADLDPAITTAEAEAAVAAANRIAADVRIVDGEEAWTIAAKTIRTWVTFQIAEDGTYGPVVDPTMLEKALAPVAKDVVRPARNASFKISGTKVVGVVPSVVGRALDTKKTAAAVGELLAARAGGGTTANVAAVLTSTSPSLSTAQAEVAAPKMREISRWTTWFSISERNNFGANIWIPTLDIDGTVVGPGETFDFWDAVGPITRARGYGDGGAIINGKTEPKGALAGGICSTSTTLFNAVLRAGFEMGARRNHYYYIDRYPLGLDATVFKSSSGVVQTMSWTNDTDYPVLIRGYKIREGGKGYVRFALYSVPNGRKVAFSTPIVTNRKAPRDTIQYTSSLPAGTSERIEYPVEGKNVSVTRTVRDASGAIIHTNTYTSRYSVITGITLVGTGGRGTGGSPAP